MFYYLGPDMPHDLFAGSGHCAGLPGWNIDRAMPFADRWLESKFPLWARSVLQDWADGLFDAADAVVFSRADDTAQRLYYYLCELRGQGQVNGPDPLILDIAKVARPSSAARSLAALRVLQVRLGITDAQAAAGIVATNARRLQQAAIPQGRVCLFAGSPAPDDRLRAIADAAGWRGAGATLAELWQDPGGVVAENTGDPVAAIAAALALRQDGPRGFFRHDTALADEANRLNAAAVVLWFAEQEEALVWHVPGQKRALAQAGLPTLVLTRRDWRAGDGADADITAFLKEIAA